MCSPTAPLFGSLKNGQLLQIALLLMFCTDLLETLENVVLGNTDLRLTLFYYYYIWMAWTLTWILPLLPPPHPPPPLLFPAFVCLACSVLSISPVWFAYIPVSIVSKMSSVNSAPMGLILWHLQYLWLNSIDTQNEISRQNIQANTICMAS